MHRESNLPLYHLDTARWSNSRQSKESRRTRGGYLGTGSQGIVPKGERSRGKRTKIQHYLQHLRKEHEKRTGKPLSAKYLHHHYGTLKNIFGYAEKNDLIVKNPMNCVDAPKMVKKPVDPLATEQIKAFFNRLSDCALDFRCMLHLMITTGMRRGECIGLKWKDIDKRIAFYILNAV